MSELNKNALNIECVNGVLKIGTQLININNLDCVFMEQKEWNAEIYYHAVFRFPNKLELRQAFTSLENCQDFIDRCFLHHKMDCSSQLLKITPLNPARYKPESWEQPLNEDDLKCKKCLPEECDGYFCRCEPRNIELARKLRAAGKSPWNKEKS